LLRAVDPALAQLDDAVRAAGVAASGAGQLLRVTLVPSIAQRWLLPRMGRWRERHPDVSIELHASQQLVDLHAEGYHAALRQGDGKWRGLEAERLIDSPLIAVGSPDAAQRLIGRDAAALADEPLLGNVSRWERWFALAGLRVRVNPVAAFNDAGMLLQAAEQNLGIALGRELFAADALHDGRLVRLAPQALPDTSVDAFWFVYPPSLRDWPPLIALRHWLRDELARSQRMLAEDARASAHSVGRQITSRAGTAPADRTGSRSRAPSAKRASRRAR
jgi:LysR family transcriptional regulator, glycine cleavage system transcriptional activator